MSHKPVCVTCQCEFRPKQCGVGLLDMFYPADKQKPQPYCLWEADIYWCPNCGFEVVMGFADQPYARQNEDGFLDELKHREANGKVIRSYF